ALALTGVRSAGQRRERPGPPVTPPAEPTVMEDRLGVVVARQAPDPSRLGVMHGRHLAQDPVGRVWVVIRGRGQDHRQELVRCVCVEHLVPLRTRSADIVTRSLDVVYKRTGYI